MERTYNVGQTYYPKQLTAPQKNVNKTAGDSHLSPFNKILEETILSNQQVKFSTHAIQRLDKRGINLDNKMLDQLNDAVNKAAKKGAKDSLILMKDLAFVVNVPNRVVVTTVDEESMKEHIFTNIDSAVII